MKKTKRLISIILTFAMLLSLCTFISFANDGARLTINAPSSANPGDTINVTVSIPQNTNALGGSFNLIYDNKNLEISTATAGTILKDYNVNINKSYTENTIKLTFEGDNALQSGGVVLTVAFNVVQGASGTSSFNSEKFKLYNADYETIETVDTASADTYIKNDAQTKIYVSNNATATTGDTFEVAVNLENPLNIYGGSFNLVYDNAKFTLTSATAGSVISSFSKQINKTYAENKVRVIFAGSGAVQTGGTVAKFTFTVNSGVSGNADFEIEKLKLADLNGTSIECISENCSTNITCNHSNMAWTVTKQATCTEDGEETYLCGCGYSNGTRVIEKTGHEVFDWVTSVEPTCTESGTEEYVCLKCDYVKETREVPATGHQHMEWVTTTDATCDSEGERAYTCADCGYVEKTEKVSAHGHTYVDTVTEPTKDEKGYTTHTCSSCGDSYTDTETEPLGYDVIYNANGGDNAPATQNKKKGETVTITSGIPVRTGYTFVGWATSSSATAAEYFDGNEYSADEDLNLYAVWSINQYTVTYKVDGETYKIATFDYGNIIEAEAEPVKEGYTFSGWSDIPITMPNENVEINGSFSVNSYTLSFDLNGGSGEFESIESDYNSEITLPESIPTKDNCIFIGWGTKATTKKASYNKGDKYTIKADTTLYAIWCEIWSGAASEKLTGAGTKANPYRITNASDLAFMRDKVNESDEQYNSACYIMTGNIVLNDTSNVANWATEAPENEWTPIGCVDHPFMGVFDGNGYTISGLYINNPIVNAEDYGNTEVSELNALGLFGVVSSNVSSMAIGNLSVSYGLVNGCNYIGSLIGQLKQGSIKACKSNHMYITGYTRVGGLIGAAWSMNGSSEISGCENSNVVHGTQYVGGIVGISGVRSDSDVTITNCKNSGKVIGIDANSKKSSEIGGCIGYAYNDDQNGNFTISGISNDGNIEGVINIAGIVGYAKSHDGKNIKIDNCKNAGDLLCYWRYNAGIVGSALKTNISNCSNLGNITSDMTKNEDRWSVCAGICGNLDESSIILSYNIGTIEANGSDNGAICGVVSTNALIDRCYNIGNIISKGTVGGISACTVNNGLITNCLNIGKVSGNGDLRSGITAYFENVGTVKQCINIGSVTSTSSTGTSVAIGYDTGTIVDCFYLDDCGAAGSGTSLTKEQMRNAFSYQFTSDSAPYSMKGDWFIGSNIWKTWPTLKGMDDYVNIPVNFELNGGYFDDYVWCKLAKANGINVERGRDALIIYNTSGKTTLTNNAGYEVIVDSHGIATSVADVGTNNSTVPTGGFVLSGHGMMEEWLRNNIEIGDKVTYDSGNYDVKVYKKNFEFTYTPGYRLYLPTPHKDGYVFDGWEYKGNKLAHDSQIYEYEPITVTATWSEPNKVAETTYGGNKYLLFDNGCSWEDAENYCESIGGHLATITSAEENTAISSLTANGSKTGYFIGANDFEKEGTFKWVTGEPLSYTNWGSSEPNDSEKYEDCVEFVKDNALWNDTVFSYYSYKGFICEIENLTPSNATIYNGHLYQAFDKQFTWQQAKEYCEKIGGHLATITSAEEDSAIKGLVENQSQPRYWLGANDEETEGVWKWVTGEDWNYTHWTTNQPDNYDGKEHSLHIYTKKYSEGDNGLWNDVPNQTYDTGFVCEFDSIEPTKVIESNGHKYQLYDTAVTWDNAKEYCDSLGGYLATVTSEEENDIIKELIDNSAKSYYYFGATDVGDEGNWRWITCETWNYTNWKAGEPNNTGSVEHFGEIKNHNDVQWNDEANGFIYDRGFICEFGNTDTYTPKYSFTHNGHYYEIYDNYLRWAYAKSYCEQQGGHLATITSVEENEAIHNGVQQYIAYKNVSLQNDVGFWLGASKRFGEWKWVTDEDCFYTNWGSGEPNNSTGMEDVMYYLTNNCWCDGRCYGSVINGFICEYETIPNTEPVKTVEYKGHKYELYDLSLPWTEAKALCEEKGGYLATITSEEEQQNIETLISNGTKNQYWLGGSDLETEGTWKWLTNEEWNFTNWDQQEPNGKATENYLQIYKIQNPVVASSLAYKWNDVPNNNYINGEENYFGLNHVGFVCEYSVKYNVTYDANDGESVSTTSAIVEENLSADLTVTAERDGYTFLGWNTDKDATEALSEYTVTSDITLYAIWQKVEVTPQTYTVTFDSNGGESVSTASATVEENTNADLTVTAEREGYTFLGWNTDKDATEALTEYTITGDVTLYAIWKKSENTIKIGDYLQMGTYYGKPILWRCVDIDENGPLMLSDKILCLKAFDARPSVNVNYGSHSYGHSFESNYWADSTIRSWLNSRATAGNVIWLCGNKPRQNCVWGPAYDEEAGFLTNFSESEIKFIKSVEHKSILSSIDSSKHTSGNSLHLYKTDIDNVVQNYEDAYAENVCDEMFLLDVKQIKEIYNNSSILGENYYKGSPTAECVSNSTSFNTDISENSYMLYWLSTPLADATLDNYHSFVRCVTLDGIIKYTNADGGNRSGVRPAFYLNDSNKYNYNGVGTTDNPFILEVLPFTVVYDVNSGNSVSKESDTIHRDSNADLTVTAEREGYTFLGWNTDKDATEILTEYTVTADVTLYAIWKKDESGTIGNLSWVLKNGKLEISGTGEIPSLTDAAEEPWYQFRNDITTIVIGDGITAIGDNAFAKLSNVTTVNIPSSVTKIGKNAFWYCSSLESIAIGENVTELGNGAFANCAALSNIQINSAIESLPSKLFENCGTIQNASIPTTLKNIVDAFGGSEITKITYAGTKEQFAEIMDDLTFETVECSADSNTYAYSDFVDQTVNVESITIDKKDCGLEIGDTAELVATISPDNATNKNVIWTSGNTLVATVDENGVVTAKAVGVANITAKSADGKASAICVVYVTRAKDVTEPTIYVSNVSAKNSDEIEVVVSMQNNPGIVSAKLKVNYNDAVMTLKNVEDLGKLGSVFHSENYADSPYTLYWDNGTATQNITENGDVVKLTFDISDNVDSGEYPIEITFDNADIINRDLLPVAFEAESGNVSITSFKYGDVNGDKAVNTIDSALLSRFLAKWQGVTVDTVAADVNKDKKVNVLDSAILKRHLGNWTGYTYLPYSPNNNDINLMSATEPKISVSSEKGYAGKTIDVYVSIEDNPGLVSARLNVNYDTAKLELTSVNDLGLLPGQTHSASYTENPYVLYWDNGAATQNYTANGNLAKLTFKIKDGAAVGNTDITVSYDEDNYDIINYDLSAVHFETVGGTIEIMENAPKMFVTDNSNGDNLSYNVKLYNPNGVGGILPVAIYKNNRLVKFSSFVAQDEVQVNIDKQGGDLVKIMWWNEFNTITPIVPAKQIELN